MSAVRVVSMAAVEHARREHARSRLAWGGAAGLVALALTVQPFADSGAWQQLALGRYIASHGLPAADPFSFLATAHPWAGSGWLLAMILAGVTAIGGLGLASLATGVAASGGLLLAVLSIRPAARVPAPWLAAAVVVGAAVARPWLASPGVAVSLLGVGAVLYVVARWREGETAPLWLLPPAFLLWANLDGGFVIGLAVLLLTLVAVGRRGTPGRQALLTAAVASLAVTVVNPAGPAVYQTLATQVGAEGQLSTAFASPDFHGWALRLFEVFAGVLIVFWAASRRVDRLDLTLGVSALGLALWSQQFVALAAVVAAPQLAHYGWETWQGHVAPRIPAFGGFQLRRRAVAAGGALALVSAAALAVAVHQASPGVAAAAESSSAPEAAAGFVARAYPGQRVYSTASWGAYLAYRLPADRSVFIYDGGPFTAASVAQYATVHLIGDGWEAVLRQNGISHAVVGDTSQEAGALHELGWAVDCFDSASGALVMSAPAPGTPPVPSAPLTIPPQSVRRC